MAHDVGVTVVAPVLPEELVVRLGGMPCTFILCVFKKYLLQTSFLQMSHVTRSASFAANMLEWNASSPPAPPAELHTGGGGGGELRLASAAAAAMCTGVEGRGGMGELADSGEAPCRLAQCAFSANLFGKSSLHSGQCSSADAPPASFTVASLPRSNARFAPPRGSGRDSVKSVPGSGGTVAPGGKAEAPGDESEDDCFSSPLMLAEKTPCCNARWVLRAPVLPTSL